MRIKAITIILVCGNLFIWSGINLLNHWDYLKNPDRVSFILNIPTIPDSVKNIECTAGAISDVIVTCAFNIEPSEFDRLLIGWPFKSKKVNSKSAFYMTEGKVGKEFDVVVEYFLDHSSFKRGGRVYLVTNSTRNLIVASRYEE